MRAFLEAGVPGAVFGAGYCRFFMVSLMGKPRLREVTSLPGPPAGYNPELTPGAPGALLVAVVFSW